MNFRLTILFFFFTPLIFAQVNLVQNPSFEDTSSCPTGYGQINHALGWDILLTYGGKNPELYNTCCTPTSVCGVPSHSNTMGYQYPKSGNGYAGIDAAYYNGTLREYIQSKLLNKLIAGNTYCICFYANLGNSCAAFIRPLGAYLDDGQVVCTYDGGVAYANTLLQPVDPQALNTFQPFNDTLNWMKVEGTFIADGSEEYITIGNFFPDSLSDIDHGYALVWASYYYIDDVSVIDVSVPVYAGDDTLIHYGDSVFIGRPPEVGLNDNCIWFINGSAIDTIAGMWVKPDSTTSYILEQDICGNISFDTVTVFVDTASGIAELATNYFINSFPNPATNELTINIAPTDKYFFDLFDLLGVKRLSVRIDSNSKIVDLIGVDSGVYVFTIVDDKGDIIKKDKLIIIK